MRDSLKTFLYLTMEYSAAVKKNEVTINKLIWSKYLDIQVSDKKARYTIVTIACYYLCKK